MNALTAVRVSLGASVGLLALKYAAYRLTGSVALYSDAMESIVNVVAGLFAVVAVWLSARPADRNHPYGHSKVEYFSAGIEGTLIALAAVAIVRAAWPRLAHPAPLEGLGAGGAFSLAATGLNALLATSLVRAGRKHRSPAVVSNGMHIWSDVLTSAGVLAGVGLAWATGWWVLDPVLAIVVALNILRVGWRVVRDSLGGLMDEGLPEADVERIRTIVEAERGEATGIHGIRTRRAGPVAFVEFHLLVPPGTTASSSHRICDRIEAALARELGNVHVTIHVEPTGDEEGAAAGR